MGKKGTGGVIGFRKGLAGADCCCMPLGRDWRRRNGESMGNKGEFGVRWKKVEGARVWFAEEREGEGYWILVGRVRGYRNRRGGRTFGK